MKNGKSKKSRYENMNADDQNADSANNSNWQFGSIIHMKPEILDKKDRTTYVLDRLASSVPSNISASFDNGADEFASKLEEILVKNPGDAFYQASMKLSTKFVKNKTAMKLVAIAGYYLALELAREGKINNGVEKMNTWEFLKHAVGGGVAVAYAERGANRKIQREGLTGAQRNRVLGTRVGLMGGTIIGYYIGELIANHARNYTVTEKVVSSAVGAAAGGAGGYVIAGYLTDKMKHDAVKRGSGD